MVHDIDPSCVYEVLPYDSQGYDSDVYAVTYDVSYVNDDIRVTIFMIYTTMIIYYLYIILSYQLMTVWGIFLVAVMS